MNTCEHELETALEIARNAGELALRHFAAPPPAEEKEDSSPVTRADRETERYIARMLRERFPLDGILGEEGAGHPSRSGRRWLVDPIDGTKDFIRGNPTWAVQLALEQGERVILGVIHCPALGETLHAAAGAGCFWNGVRVTASEVSRIDHSILTVSGLNAAAAAWPVDGIRSLLEECWTVRAFGGACNVMMLARGKADIWLSGRGMEWDYAPARIVADEIGACFLTRPGDGRIDRKHCVLCAPGVEREVRRVLDISGCAPVDSPIDSMED